LLAAKVGLLIARLSIAAKPHCKMDLRVMTIIFPFPVCYGPLG